MLFFFCFVCRFFFIWNFFCISLEMFKIFDDSTFHHRCDDINLYLEPVVYCLCIGDLFVCLVWFGRLSLYWFWLFFGIIKYWPTNCDERKFNRFFQFLLINYPNTVSIAFQSRFLFVCLLYFWIVWCEWASEKDHVRPLAGWLHFILISHYQLFFRLRCFFFYSYHTSICLFSIFFLFFFLIPSLNILILERLKFHGKIDKFHYFFFYFIFWINLKNYRFTWINIKKKKLLAYVIVANRRMSFRLIWFIQISFIL